MLLPRIFCQGRRLRYSQGVLTLGVDITTEQAEEMRRRRKRRERWLFVVTVLVIAGGAAAVALPRIEQSEREAASRVPAPLEIDVRTEPAPAGILGEVWRARMQLTAYRTRPLAAMDRETGLTILKKQGDLSRSPMVTIDPTGTVTELAAEGGWPCAIDHNDAAMAFASFRSDSVTVTWLNADSHLLWERKTDLVGLVPASAGVSLSPDGSHLLVSRMGLGPRDDGLVLVNDGDTRARFKDSSLHPSLCSVDWVSGHVFAVSRSHSDLVLRLLSTSDLAVLAEVTLSGGAAGSPGFVTPSVHSFETAGGGTAWWVNAFGSVILVDDALTATLTISAPSGGVFVAPSGWCLVFSEAGAALAGPGGELAWSRDDREAVAGACSEDGRLSVVVFQAEGSEYILEVIDHSGRTTWSREVSGQEDVIPVATFPAEDRAVVVYSPADAVALIFEPGGVLSRAFSLDPAIVYEQADIAGHGRYLLLQRNGSRTRDGSREVVFFDLKAVTETPGP